MPPRSTARKQQIIDKGPRVMSPLTIEVRELLYAFDLAAPLVRKGGSYASRLAEQQELALGLIDWAICECDRGVDLLKAMTKPDEIAR